jgi:CRP-like cAMP-binding protein
MRIDVLREVELFRDLDAPTLASLAQEFVEIHVPAQFPVIQEGTPVDAFFVVSAGQVVVCRDTVGKPVQLLSRVGPHEFFGELALFTHGESSISARTTQQSRILKIGKQVLLDLLRDRPGILLKLQMAAAKRHTIHAAAALELGQRSEVRIRVDRRVVLALADGTSQAAVLDNLSPGGLSLRGAPSAWKEGDEVGFELKFGDDVLGCVGRVTWVRGDLLGFAFADTSDEHNETIQLSLRRLFGPSQRR